MTYHRKKMKLGDMVVLRKEIFGKTVRAKIKEIPTARNGFRWFVEYSGRVLHVSRSDFLAAFTEKRKIAEERRKAIYEVKRLCDHGEKKDSCMVCELIKFY